VTQPPAQDQNPRFKDRRDAGRQLAERLQAHRGAGTVVLGIPRGGVVVAAEVARELGAELDIVVARKLGAPGEAELAIGAVAADGEKWLNQSLIAMLGITPSGLETITRREQVEAERRERTFRGERPALSLKDRTVIVVDDGLATGATAQAALRSVRRRGPGALILAVPVGARDSCRMLATEADQVICPYELVDLFAISVYYDEFSQVEDSEVQAILIAARRTETVPPAG